MKAETTSKQPEWNSKLQRGKQKETGNDNLPVSVNVKISKLTQKVHGTLFSNLLKALMDTTKHSNKNILQMNKEKLQQLTKKMLTSLEHLHCVRQNVPCIDALQGAHNLTL